MKKLIIILFLAIVAIPAFAQIQAVPFLPEVNGKVVFENTVTVNGSSNVVLFNRAKEWVLFNSKSPQLTTFKENEQIIGTGSVNVRVKDDLILSSKYQLVFTVECDFNGNRCTMRISDINYRNAEGNTRFVYPIEKYNEQIKKSPGNKSTDDATAIKSQIDDVFTSLYNALNSNQTVHVPSDQELQWCNMLTKTIDYSDMHITYNSPPLYKIRVSKSIYPGTSSMTISFLYHQSIYSPVPQTVYIKFDDGASLTFTDSTGGSIFGPDGYLCNLTMDENNIGNFKDKKITPYQINDKSFTVDDVLGAQVQAWVTCVINLY